MVLREKRFFVEKKSLMLHKMLCRQKQIDVARKSVSCQQNKAHVAQKKHFMLTKAR